MILKTPKKKGIQVEARMVAGHARINRTGFRRTKSKNQIPFEEASYYALE
jgi:hypothetical protein